MLDESKSHKIIDLTTRAISINEKLLAEEKRFVEAVADKRDITFLTQSIDLINCLIRKEVLFNQAAQMLLKKNY